MSIDVVIAVNHAGYLEFEICDLDARPGNNKCRQLQRCAPACVQLCHSSGSSSSQVLGAGQPERSTAQHNTATTDTTDAPARAPACVSAAAAWLGVACSADGKGPHFWLPYVSNWTGGNSGYVRPAYGDGSFSWYTLPEIKPPEGCKKQQLCNAFKDMVRAAWRAGDQDLLLCARHTVAACTHACPAADTCRSSTAQSGGCRPATTAGTASCSGTTRRPTAAGRPACHRTRASRPAATCRCVGAKTRLQTRMRCFLACSRPAVPLQVYPECGKPGTTYPERFWNCAG